MLWKLALLFTVVPTVELALLIFIGSWLGPVPTTLIVLVTGFTGAWLAKREGLGVLRQLRTDLQRGLPPADRLMEGALVLAGGLLLITPGVFTDLAGFLLIVPFSRRRLAPIVLRWVMRKLEIGAVGEGWNVEVGQPRVHRAEPAAHPATPFEHPIPEEHG